MFKGLLGLSALTLAPIAVSATNLTNLNSKEITPQTVLESWDHVGLEVQATTPASGTHNRSAQKSDSAISKSDWDVIKDVSDITLHGLFYFHTYHEPKTLKIISLNKDSSTSDKVTFKFHDVHEKWSGWGHQTSEIAITVSVNYDKNGSNKAIIAIDNYVHARTAGSSHEASTTSRVDKIEIKI